MVLEILNFIKAHKVKLNDKFSVIVNQGPGICFSGIRVSLAVAKGLKISKNVKFQKMCSFMDIKIQI